MNEFLQNIQVNYAATRSDAVNAQRVNNRSIWEELSKEYDIRHATFAELCDISYRPYEARQITPLDHATLSFDPTRIPHTANAKFYFTPADHSGRRDWIAEYKAGAEFELKNGNPESYEYIMNHFVKGIFGRLERK